MTRRPGRRGFGARLGAGCCLLAATTVLAAPPPNARKPVAAARQGERKADAPARQGQPKADATPTSTGDPVKDQALQSAERDRLTTRIAELKKQIAAGEKTRSGAAVALARAEKALGDVNRRLDELAQRQKATQDLVVSLERQRSGTEGQVAAGEAAFARTLTAMSANRDRDARRIWLAGGDPGDPLLTDIALGHVARAEAADLDLLQQRIGELQSRRQRADDDQRALADQASAQKSARETLAAEQAAQRVAFDRLSRQIAEQRTTASALEADEKRLTRVVERLQRMIEQQAAEERARRQAAKRLADQQAAAAAAAARNRGSQGTAPKAREPAPPPPRVEAAPDEPAGGGPFAQLRGQLRLPVRGTITGRFGSARGGSGGTWKGLFVRAEPNADVHAVAPGKVIFADDLRGFGNLLIVDHGNQYLSIYANNAALLRQAGDRVQAGDVVSRAGNSSGDEQTGLYFEIRFRGRPIDPMPWIGSR